MLKAASKLAVGVGVLAVGVGMSSGTAFAQGTSGFNPLPAGSQVPMLDVAPYSYSLLPGQKAILGNYSLLKRLSAFPNLPIKIKDLLESTPVTVSANPAGHSYASTTSGDPVMNNGCTWRDIYGFTLASFNSYLGFSANGSVVTQVSVPNNYVDITGWALGTITYDGSTFTASNPIINTWYSTVQVDGSFTQSVGGLASSQFGAQIDFNMYGNDGSTAPVTCSGT